MQWSNDNEDDLPRADITAEMVMPYVQRKTRFSHRQRTARSHDTSASTSGFAKRRNDFHEPTTTGDDSPQFSLRRKPPVAARPAAVKANAALAKLKQRRQSVPPATLDIAVESAEPAGAHRQTPDQEQQHQPSPALTARTSASSDQESGGSSADSATSGFSSGGSDVSKATEGGDENASETLRRHDAKAQKPALKPKRKS